MELTIEDFSQQSKDDVSLLVLKLSALTYKQKKVPAVPAKLKSEGGQTGRQLGG